MAKIATPQRVDIVEPRLRPTGSRVAALGLLLAGSVPLIYSVAGLLTGLSPAELPFFLVVAAIGLAGAGLVWRFGTWSKVVGIVVSVLVGFPLFWAVFGLSYPQSPIEFVTALMHPAGVLMGLVGSITALVAKRRGNLKALAGNGERSVVFVVVGLLVLALVSSSVLYAASRESVGANAARGAFTVTMKSFEFDAKTIRVPAGTSKILVRNDDPVTHTFTIDELGIDETVLPRSEKLIELDGQSGRYVLYCKPHSGEADPEGDNMAAYLVIA